MDRKPLRERAPQRDRPARPTPSAPAQAPVPPPGEIGDDGGGQRSDVGVPYTGEGNVQRPRERQIPAVPPDAQPPA